MGGGRTLSPLQNVSQLNALLWDRFYDFTVAEEERIQGFCRMVQVNLVSSVAIKIEN